MMSQINLKHLFCLKKTKDWNKNFFSFFRYKENHLFIFTHRVNIKKKRHVDEMKLKISSLPKGCGVIWTI